MLTEGGAYAFKRMQVGATATGDGNSMTPLTVNGGSYALLTAQVVGISGDTITWEGTIDEENWVALPALNVATRAVATTATADGIYRLVVTSLVAVRARVSTYGSGTIYVYGLLTASGEPGFLAEESVVTDHALLDNLDYASAGHTGFEEEGTAAAAITTHVGLADPHTGYLLASGARAGASSQAQAFTNGIVAPSMRPASDSTAALEWQNAAGTAFVTGDSTNRQLVISSDANQSLKIRSTANFPQINLGTSDVRNGNLVWDDVLSVIKFNTYNLDFGFMVNNGVLYAGPSGGSVGVGTTSPGSKLDVIGVVQADGLRLDVAQSGTTSITNAALVYSVSTGTPGPGFGVAVLAGLESSTANAQDAGRLTWEWDRDNVNSATHATRSARVRLSANYTSTESVIIDGIVDSSGPRVAFLGGTPVAKAAAYTQTYSTADRTLAAYTADDESGAYSGIDNAQGGTVYAQLTDLNALRTAYENLRAFVEDLAQHHNSLLDDMQALNLVG